MRLTIKTQDEKYLDLEIIPSERRIIFHSPIPHLELQQLLDLADAYNYVLDLPIIESRISPDKEIKHNVANNIPLEDQLTLLLSTFDFIITDK